MTRAELRKLQRDYERAAAKVEVLRAARNDAIRQHIAEGWTHAAISEATGLSRGRVAQIVKLSGGERVDDGGRRDG